MAMYKNCGFPSSTPMSKMPATSNSMSYTNKVSQQPKSILKNSRPADSQDEALVDALRQSQAANCALEAAVNMQAADLRRLAAEMEVLREENAELRLRLKTTAILEVSNKALSGVNDVLAQKAEFAARMAPPDLLPPSYHEVASQEVAVQARSTLIDAGMQTEPEKGRKGGSRRSQESVSDTSAHVAEAFRLGWLAGAGAKKNNGPESNSTRSEVPSDDALSVTHSDGQSSTGGYSAAVTPPSVATPPSLERSPSPMPLDADVDLITSEC